MYIKKCNVCDKEFTVKYKSQLERRKNCSKECQRLSSRTLPLIKKCKGCNNDFTPTKDNLTFCNIDCYLDHKNVRIFEICKICGKEFSYNPSKPKTSCSRSCSNVLMHKLKGHNIGIQNKICLNCWKLYQTKTVYKESSHYCSVECFHEYKQEITTCTWCNQKITKPKSRTKKYENSFCNDEHRLLWLNTEKAEPSQAELKTIKILDNIGIPYQFQYPIGYYLLDFAIVDKKIDIEIDSEYHHSLPDRIPKDKRRDKFMKSLGWKVIRIPSQQVSREIIIEQLDKILYTYN